MSNRTFRLFVAFMALLALAVLAGCKGGNSCRRNPSDLGDDPVGGPDPGTVYDSYGEECLAHMNAEREKVGSPPLEWDIKLAACTAGHSHDMCERGFRGHA